MLVSPNSMECDLNIKQDLPTSCAVRCQQIILRDYGIDVSEKELREIARRQGWFDDQVGMYMHDNGKLLGCFGIGYNHSQNNDLHGLKFELQQQHRVMVNINKSKLCADSEEAAQDRHHEACHAVIVTRVLKDESYVQITDPSTGYAEVMASAMDFTKAWEDSDCYMLATDAPARYEYDPISKTMRTID